MFAASFSIFSARVTLSLRDRIGAIHIIRFRGFCVIRNLAVFCLLCELRLGIFTLLFLSAVVKNALKLPLPFFYVEHKKQNLKKQKKLEKNVVDSAFK